MQHFHLNAPFGAGKPRPGTALTGGDFRVVQLVDRTAIEAEIDRLIALLDAMDGDVDLEDEHDYCLAGDDGCGLTRAVQGGAAWGSEWDADHSPVRPLYGVDQTLGPINLREADREYYRALHTA